MELIPSLDLLGGRVVRLTRGEFATAHDYGEPEQVLDALGVRNTRLHVVDLEGSRSGRPIETDAVRRLALRDIDVQVGGGIRSLEDAQTWFDCGAKCIVVGTIAANAPALLASLVAAFGTQRIVPAVDIRDGVVRTNGWERSSTTSTSEVFTRLESLGFAEVLVTDITRDGALRGPSFALYRELRELTRMRVIASGGVSNANDVIALSRLGNISACVVGKALLERRIDAAFEPPSDIPTRIVPCLDVRDGRVVKGVAFENIRDAGDPVACAERYEEEGADELVMLDISATPRGFATAVDTVRRVADALFIPFTIGGGVRNVADFRAMLRAGADRVAINTAAVRRPELIRECASEFGAQAVVVSCDVSEGKVAVAGGSERTNLDAVDWCKRAQELGAGEILLTSIDRDGTNLGFDTELLRSITSQLQIGVIASGGAGALPHFRDAIEAGGARAVLAASLFHDRVFSVGDVKRYLAAEGIPVR